MCGIAGVFDFNGKNRIDEHVIEKMTNAMKHRGPDGKNQYVNKHIGLGFTRLSFLDLDGGMQPIFNENSELVLVCNGEIYNFIALRTDLEKKGHKFKTDVDIEVILHLFEEYGVDVTRHLNGQFAFVIYNTQTRELYCARDHIGIAPFFYTVYNDMFIFASEIKAILEYPGVPRQLNLDAVDQLLTFPGCRAVNTFFKKIYTLENGHFMKFKSIEEIKQHEYWDVKFPEVIEDRGESYYQEKILHTLEEAVRARLFADVPVGFYISGGLDSSIIASLISKNSQTLYHSFSIDFSDRSISESQYQRAIQRCVRSIHHKRFFTEQDINRYFKTVIFHSETPLRETYNTASLALSEMVRDSNVKAVLTGEGADEFFSGYVGYKFDVMRQTKLDNVLSDEEKEVNERVFGDPFFFYERSLVEFEHKKKLLYSSEIAGALNTFSSINTPVFKPGVLRGLDIQQRRTYADYKLRLPEHLLADHGDRMGYANSVEARYPFLDIDMVELSLLVPSKYKLNHELNEKYILKQMARGIVPNEIIERRKFAFVAPGVPSLLKYHDEYISEMLSYDKIKHMGIFNPDFIEELSKEYTTPGFKLNLPFDTDYLIIVLTVNALCDIFSLSL